MSIRLKLIIGMGAALLASTLLLVSLNIVQMRGFLIDTCSTPPAIQPGGHSKFR